MSENCSHNCSSCGETCASRTMESFRVPLNPQSSVKKVIGVVSGKGGVGKSLVTSLMACKMRARNNRLNDWGLYFRKCKICGKVFLAKSQRYELCSDKCRKKQSLQNKREFDERARENNYDLLYKNECQNWRNKINKAKKTSGFPADRLEEMLIAFESFKQEALQRKQAVKKKTASPKEFTDWLLQQSNIIVELAETEN